MNPMLTDDDLRSLLGEASAAFTVPEEGPGFVLEELADTAPTHPHLRRRGLQLTAAAAGIAVVAVLAASVGGPGGGGQQSTPASLVGGAAAVGGQSDRQASSSGATTADQQAPVAGTPAEQGGARVVKTGTITLAVDDGKVGATVRKVQAVVVGAGGYVADQSSQELAASPTATITMRVPVGRFEATLQQVRDVGAKVVSVESSGKDVTSVYADTEAQIGSLKAARGRFLAILAGAKTIAETLTVQQRVDEVQGQIDRLEGQRRVLQSQSDLATLTVSVGEEGASALSTEPSGLSRAWDRAVHGFTSGLEGLVAGSGRTLLVLLVAGAAFLLARLGWRLARRRLV